MDFRGGLCGEEGGEFGTAEYTPNVWLSIAGTCKDLQRKMMDFRGGLCGGGRGVNSEPLNIHLMCGSWGAHRTLTRTSEGEFLFTQDSKAGVPQTNVTPPLEASGIGSPRLTHTAAALCGGLSAGRKHPQGGPQFIPSHGSWIWMTSQVSLTCWSCACCILNDSRVTATTSGSSAPTPY